MISLRRISVWGGTLFLAVVFVYAGASKLIGASAMGWADRFHHWGYSAHALYVVAVFETLGGIGVLIPQVRRAAAVTLVVLMLGALYTHVVNAEFPRVLPPLVLGGLAVLVYASQRRRREH